MKKKYEKGDILTIKGFEDRKTNTIKIIQIGTVPGEADYCLKNLDKSWIFNIVWMNEDTLSSFHPEKIGKAETAETDKLQAKMMERLEQGRVLKMEGLIE